MPMPSKRSASLRFPNQTPEAPLPSPKRATCPAHLILLDLIIRTLLGDEEISLNSSLRNFLQSHVTSSLLGPNIFHSTLFSNTLGLRSSLNVTDQVSRPHKTGKIIVLYTLIFIFLDRNWKTNDSAPNDSKHSLTSVCS